MVNFLPTTPVGGTVQTVRRSSARRIVPSSAGDKREALAMERRRMKDRRSRRVCKQIMDRRSGPQRRRSSIDFSV